MFSSFFGSSKKKSPSDPIPGYQEPQSGENQQPSQIPDSSQWTFVPEPTPPPKQQFNRQQSIVQTNYLNGVPFKLSAELLQGDSTEKSRVQIDEILSKMSVFDNKEYDFSLERSLVG